MNSLFNCGAHFFLLPLILQPVIVVTKANIHDPLAMYHYSHHLFVYCCFLDNISYAWTTLAHVAGNLFIFHHKTPY